MADSATSTAAGEGAGPASGWKWRCCGLISDPPLSIRARAMMCFSFQQGAEHVQIGRLVVHQQDAGAFQVYLCFIFSTLSVCRYLVACRDSLSGIGAILQDTPLLAAGSFIS